MLTPLLMLVAGVFLAPIVRPMIDNLLKKKTASSTPEPKLDLDSKDLKPKI